MDPMPTEPVTVPVDLPIGEVPSAGGDVRSLASELRALWLVEQVRLRRIGIGKAAELAGMPRAAFMSLLGAHGVPVIDYPVDELDRELEGPATR
jgi:predicted HTH domain antitoxin